MRWGESNIKIIIALAILGLIIFLYLQNNSIVTTITKVQSDRLPGTFHGYRIVHLSDLHNKAFGRDQKRLVDRIRAENPDLIVFTGDIVDSRRHGADNGIALMRQITKIAPVYYVTGNHEWALGKVDVIRGFLEKEGVKVLQDEHDVIQVNGDKIYIIGIDDPVSRHGGQWSKEPSIVKSSIQKAVEGIPKGESFKILLTHRPEKFSIYSEFDIDLSLAGHAHGGQVRLPFVGGLFAPNQGILPKYSEGKHKIGSSAMIVSRGLGNSIAPQRLFNRPEIVIVELENNR